MKNDTISRQMAIDALINHFKKSPTTAIRARGVVEELPSAEPEIIRCGECVNHLGKRCIQADHHTNDIECCMSVFGAKRRTDETD